MSVLHACLVSSHNCHYFLHLSKVKKCLKYLPCLLLATVKVGHLAWQMVVSYGHTLLDPLTMKDSRSKI
jgi:hypothetical protein